MSLERPLLFLFTAIGSLNGFFLMFYFIFFVGKRSQASLFLTALVAMVSIRILKSTLVIVNENISEILSPIGLVACFLIGPLLFLYIKAANSEIKDRNDDWLYHILPVIFLLSFAGFYFLDSGSWWNSEWLRGTMYLQWFTYILLSAALLRHSFRTLVSNHKKLSDEEVWFISIVLGIGAIWLA